MAMDALTVKFESDGNRERVNLPQRFQEYPHIAFAYLTYVMNYKNIDTVFQNTRLYLNTAGTTFLDLTPGLYDIQSLNNGPLNPVLGGSYYKI